jgi:serine/threonine protein kinase
VAHDSGTFGAVHKARNLKTNKIVAVKMIRSLRGSSLSQDLEREIRIMKKLDHVFSALKETNDSQILYNFTTRLRKPKNTISLVTLLWNMWNAGHSTIVFRHLMKCQKLLFNTSFVKYYVHWNTCTNDIKSRIEILNLLYSRFKRSH